MMLSASFVDASSISRYIKHMRTTVDISKSLLKNAKHRAAERGVTLSVVLEDALRQHLAPKPNVEAPPFKLITVGGDGLVDPNINLGRICELIARDDEEKYGTAGQK